MAFHVTPPQYGNQNTIAMFQRFHRDDDLERIGHPTVIKFRALLRIGMHCVHHSPSLKSDRPFLGPVNLTAPPTEYSFEIRRQPNGIRAENFDLGITQDELAEGLSEGASLQRIATAWGEQRRVDPHVSKSYLAGPSKFRRRDLPFDARDGTPAFRTDPLQVGIQIVRSPVGD
ncbi:hypothetical protein S23_05350 [Bradyrhizobium cosmicum]|uniref:Uncharacterized protein n=1 Tax=Bradyrhizobium cosmicum TaxID=1404864 RepID=A0AAI8M854_9BRAD|nr:hypothetical protein S23_05350 [Bradyrhizobium cosmicum]